MDIMTTTARGSEKRTVCPPVNIRETEKEVVLEAEMPGLTRESISVELSGDELTIKGDTGDTGVPQGYTVLYRERVPHAYLRTFVLGSEVAREGIDAKYKDGVLAVTIPKAAEKQPKKVEIKS